MDDHGTDITPDMVRPGCFPRFQRSANEQQSYSSSSGHATLPVDDLEADSSTTVGQRSDPLPPGLANLCRYPAYEPLDESTDSTAQVHRRVFERQRQQASNGTSYYKSEENRLSTFVDWRYQRIVRKEDLAKNGFVFTGTGDKVRCVYCNGLLREWEMGDVVEEEHHRNFPHCPFIRGENVGNIPLQPVANGYHTSDAASRARSCQSIMSVRGQSCDLGNVNECQGASPGVCQPTAAGRQSSPGSGDAAAGCTYNAAPRNPRMSVEPDRLATFEGWPTQMKQKPEQLARAGLYYTGDGDKVKCFHCDVLLYNWDPEDDPFVEHARWYPDCQYIHLVKGDDFVRDVHNGKLKQEDVMQMSAVQAVLFMGNSEESVKKAVASLRQNEGPSAEVTAEKLLLHIMEQEDSFPSLINSITGSQSPSEDLQSLQRENESLRDKQQCKVCMENDVEVIFNPCMHFVCCASCGTAVSTCPICRVPIQSINRVFMA